MVRFTLAMVVMSSQVAFATEGEPAVAARSDAKLFAEGLLGVFVQREGIYLLSWVAVGVTSTMFIYFLTHWMKMGGQVFIALLAVQLAALAAIPAVVWLSNKVGKRDAYLIGISFWVVVQLGLVFLQPAHSTLVFVLAGCAGVGVGAAHVLPWAMRLLMGPGPALLLVLSIVVALCYPLSRERHAKVQQEITRRRLRAGQPQSLLVP